MNRLLLELEDIFNERISEDTAHRIIDTVKDILAYEKVHGKIDKNTRIYEVITDIRTYNALYVFFEYDRSFVYKRLNDFSNVSLEKLKSTRGIGAKMVSEIKEICAAAGVKLLP